LVTGAVTFVEKAPAEMRCGIKDNESLLIGEQVLVAAVGWNKALGQVGAR